jgi:mitogen-activated protein kinase 1/3
LDNVTSKKVAIKKLNQIEDIIDAKRALREIRILRYMRHPNIVRLVTCVYDNTDPTSEFGTLYLV